MTDHFKRNICLFIQMESPHILMFEWDINRQINCIHYKLNRIKTMSSIIMSVPRLHCCTHLRCSFINIHLFQMIDIKMFREYTTNFVLRVSHQTSEIYIKTIIPKGELTFLQEILNNLQNFLKIIKEFPLREEYFLQEFYSDKQFYLQEFIF